MARALPEHVRSEREDQCRNLVGWSPCILYKHHRFDGSKIRCQSSPPKDPSVVEVTCQACFGEYKLVRGKASLHGYKRPGYGFIMGRCLGAQEDPYEVSCEITKKMLQHVEKYLEQTESLLTRLRARPKTVTYTTKVYVGTGKTSRADRGYKVVGVDIKKEEPAGFADTHFTLDRPVHYGGDRPRKVGEPIPAHHPGYDRALEFAIRETERDLKDAELQADELREKIESWVFKGLPGGATA